MKTTEGVINVSIKSQRDRECDSAIIEVSRGNREALSVIYNHCAAMICSFVKSIFGSSVEVEDVLQETMLRILQYAKNYRPGTNATAWVLSIVRNCAKDMLAERDLKSVVHIDSEEYEYIKETIPDNELDIESFVIIHDALQTLNPIETVIVKLKIYYGFSFKEIASVLESNAVAVTKRYSRAIKKLRNYYERESKNG